MCFTSHAAFLRLCVSHHVQWLRPCVLHDLLAAVTLCKISTIQQAPAFSSREQLDAHKVIHTHPARDPVADLFQPILGEGGD